MSKLDELIAELCPDGVPYVKLNKICAIYDGTHTTPKYTEHGVKFISVENIKSPYDTINIIDTRTNQCKRNIISKRFITINDCAYSN